MNLNQNNVTAATQDNALELDLVSRELPPGELNLESLPNEYSYTRLATYSSIATVSSSGCSSAGTISSASCISS